VFHSTAAASFQYKSTKLRYSKPVPATVMMYHSFGGSSLVAAALVAATLSARWWRRDAVNRPADASHSRHARSRSHHRHRAATVRRWRLLNQRLMLTEMEDQPGAARRAEDEARALSLLIPLPRRAAIRASRAIFLFSRPPHQTTRVCAVCHRLDVEATIRALSHRWLSARVFWPQHAP
jgi:hypothetical protein